MHLPEKKELLKGCHYIMSEKILVVEDDQTFRLFLTEALKKSGYQVDEATTVEDALQKIKQYFVAGSSVLHTI